jgi:hypothetical protein
MTRRRACAYARVTQTLRDLGPAKLHPEELDCIRGVADSFLFSADVAAGHRHRDAISDLSRIHVRLVASGRWTDERAARLIDDVWACAPDVDMTLPTAI